MQAAGGETLAHIVIRKEAERAAGQGEFWWGIGNSLGAAVDEAAGVTNGNLPVLFSKMLGPPKLADSDPASVCVWNGWRSSTGRSGPIPEHVLVTGGVDPTGRYYALACQSDHPLAITDHGPFDPAQCRTALGKVPGSSQVTCILRDIAPGSHAQGQYRLGFRARLKRLGRSACRVGDC